VVLITPNTTTLPPLRKEKEKEKKG